ncbi:uncharacterized protein LOC142646305 [Dermatophagoides pteronyssinus]|uniref:uncharacterized protein LOC142646305 n=2 Tax=Dermatophagoides pteronyssinus TaxID=6956 RepID=UPI003F67A215
MSDQSVSPRNRDDSKCAVCKQFLRRWPERERKTIKSQNLVQDALTLIDLSIRIGDVVCRWCMNKIHAKISLEKKRQRTSSTSETVDMEASTSEMAISQASTSSSEQISSQSSHSSLDPLYMPSVHQNPELFEVPYFRSVSTHAYCFICSGSSDLKSIPLEARLQVFRMRQVFVPANNVCCKRHMIGKLLHDDEVGNIRIASDRCEMSRVEMNIFPNSLSPNFRGSIFENLANRTISDTHLKTLTGFCWRQIEQLREWMSSMRDTEGRSAIQAICVFLHKMRSGNSDNIIAVNWGIDSGSLVSSYIKSVMRSFENEVLPNRFGINSISRDSLIRNHTSLVAKKLFDIDDDHLMIICDGTYLRHEKSSNNVYQRKSYSGQKKTSLCKPFTICATDGFVIELAGPYSATKNDADILKEVLRQPRGLSTILQPGDYFVLDRGFRDVVPMLENRGYHVLMPALKGKRPQLTTIESNESRFVTKIRWVVEAIHGIIGQRYKLLHHQLRNNYLSNARTLCRIACFLQNSFGKSLSSDLEDMDVIIDRMKSRNNTNALAKLVEKENWNRRTRMFQTLSEEDIADFPRLTIPELKIFFTGNYQLGQAMSYLAEMINEDGSLTFQYAKERDVIQWEVKSRHINRKTYKCYVQYVPNRNDTSGIIGHYCSCFNGNRTIGCCSHVAAIVFYLSHCRYQSHIYLPADYLTKLFDFTEMTTVIDEDSEED